MLILIGVNDRWGVVHRKDSVTIRMRVVANAVEGRVQRCPGFRI